MVDTNGSAGNIENCAFSLLLPQSTIPIEMRCGKVFCARLLDQDSQAATKWSTRPLDDGGYLQRNPQEELDVTPFHISLPEARQLVVYSSAASNELAWNSRPSSFWFQADISSLIAETNAFVESPLAKSPK